MSPHYEAPDGGWGWWVVAGTALINIFNQSLLSVFGILVGYKVEIISGSEYVGIVMSLNSCLTNFSGILIGPLMKVLSTKTIAQIGVTMVSLGLLLSGLAPTYHLIALGYGVLSVKFLHTNLYLVLLLGAIKEITNSKHKQQIYVGTNNGLGLGIIAASTFLMINSYFLTRKAMAVGLAMAGTSAGQIIMPLFIAYCRQLVGVDITIFILAGCSFCGILGTFCFYPVEEVMDHSEPLNKFFPKVLYNRAKADNNNCSQIEEGKEEILENKDVNTLPEDLDNTASKNQPKRNFKWYWNEIKKGNDFSVLKDWRFVLILLGLALTFVTNITFSTFLPLYLADDVLLAEMQVSTCLSVLSTFDLLGRLTLPAIAKRVNLSPRQTFIAGLIILIVLRSSIAAEGNFTTLVVLSAAAGLARSAPVVNQNIIAAESSPSDKASSAVGMFMIFKGVLVLIFGNVLGYLKHYFGNYSIVIHTIDGMSTAVVLSWTIEVIYSRWLSQ